MFFFSYRRGSEGENGKGGEGGKRGVKGGEIRRRVNEKLRIMG